MPLEVTAPSLRPTAAPAGTAQDIGSKDVFLKLLVAQMSHQDPLKPSDPTEMSAQLARFNMVEQQISTNKFLEQIAAGGGMGGGGDISGSSASYLGRTVTLNQNNISYSGGTANFSVNLAGNSSQTYVVLVDDAGVPVRSMSLGALGAGAHQLSWDGMLDTGAQAPAGNYSVEVMSSNIDGLNIPASVQRSGLVEAVRMTSGGVQLVVGGVPANISDITEIRL
jgi:flagellar basal-body rod modification protein FlgD